MYATELLSERGFALAVACFLAVGTILRLPMAIAKIVYPDKVDLVYTLYTALFSVICTLARRSSNLR